MRIAIQVRLRGLLGSIEASERGFCKASNRELEAHALTKERVRDFGERDVLRKRPGKSLVGDGTAQRFRSVATTRMGTWG